MFFYPKQEILSSLPCVKLTFTYQDLIVLWQDHPLNIWNEFAGAVGTVLISYWKTKEQEQSNACRYSLHWFNFRVDGDN